MKLMTNIKQSFSNPFAPCDMTAHHKIYSNFTRALCYVTILCLLCFITICCNVGEYFIGGLQKSIDEVESWLVDQETLSDKDSDDELDPASIEKMIIKCYLCINQKISQDYTSNMGKLSSSRCNLRKN